MALTLGDNFSYQGAKPLDARLKYDTLANMKAVADATMYDGCMAYCVATDKTYQWKSTNTVDPDTGKWREFSSGGGGADYTAGDGIVIENDEISIDPMPAEDMDDVIDELPTGGNIAVTGYVPLATIIQYYGETPPQFFLACDGTTYNKSDYPELAIHLLSLTTHSQYEVSGDNTKFKVPDLRGEFIRGTGTNGHTDQGSGANVGVHQDGTGIGVWARYNDFGFVAVPDSSGISDSLYSDPDSIVDVGARKGYLKTDYVTSQADATAYVVPRSTNTSVLFCIAYKDIYSNPMNDYSTDEKVVGTWVDGKTLYQKTLTGTISVDTDKTSKVTTLGNISTSIDNVVSIDAIRKNADGGVFVSLNASTAYANEASYVCNVFVNNSTGNLVVEDNRLADNGRIILATVKYTKTTD